MKRRDFMKIQSSGGKDIPRPQAGLDEFTEPLSRKNAYHFLRRLHFAPTQEMVNDLTGKTASAAFDQLVGTGKQPLPEASGDWATKIELDPLTQGSVQIKGEIERAIKGRNEELIDWWLTEMRDSTNSAREKMVLFWHSVWCIEFTFDTLSLLPTPLMLANNQLLREFAYGNHKSFAEAMTLSGAYLLYQSLQHSSAANGSVPNENYMRELFELFTMGVGHYSELDIREGSRALTGWRTAWHFESKHASEAPFSTYFESAEGVHDIGAKEFMGETIPKRHLDDNTEHQVRNEEVMGILDIMYRQKPEAISQFICNKIYRYFVYSYKDSDDKGIIDEMADAMEKSNFEILPVMKKLFTSKHFFDEANIGIQVKPPPEFFVGLETQLGVSYDFMRDAVFQTDQVLYDPPNVGSWQAYRTWLSTATYPLRIKHAMDIVDLADKDNLLVALGKKFSNYADAAGIVGDLSEYFLPVEITQERIDLYKGKLLTAAGVDEAGWSTATDEKAAAGLRELIKEFVKAPDFQLY